MPTRTRILLSLAGAGSAAVLVWVLGPNPWQGMQVPPPTAVAAAAAAPDVPENLAPAVGATRPTGAVADTGSANLRTEVPVSPNARRVPLSDADLVRNRAAALATKLGLSPADEAELLAVLLEEQTRRAATLAELRRKPDDAEVNARVRTELSAILAWKTEKLRSRFGFERANLLMQRR